MDLKQIESLFKKIYIQEKTYNTKNIVETWKTHWVNHHADVLDYFKKRKQDLLVFDIETQSAKHIVDFFSDLSFSSDVFPKEDWMD